MAWESVTVTLDCGCDGTGRWDEVFPGDPQRCDSHGETIVKRVSRITETSGSRNFRLGTTAEEEVA